jgi:RNA polymerase sigma-70 factor, ECF subfamily
MEANARRSDGLPLPEAQIVDQCKAGNREQFEALISPYLHSIKLIAYSILRNVHDMEEIMQETILKAFLHIGQLREGENFKSWLLQIAANEARMRLRKDRKHLYESLDEETDEKPFQPKQFVNWRNIPSQELERKELRQVLTAALESLEDGYREVFLLRDVQHLSAAETGKIMGLNEGAVNTRLHRARMQMREQLTPLFKAPGKARMLSLKMMTLMGRIMMRRTISCRHVTREMSNYINGELTPELRHQIEEHLQYCDRCSVLLDTTRKVVYVAGDDHVFSVPFECKVEWQKIAGEADRESP